MYDNHTNTSLIPHPRSDHFRFNKGHQTPSSMYPRAHRASSPDDLRHQQDSPSTHMAYARRSHSSPDTLRAPHVLHFGKDTVDLPNILELESRGGSNSVAAMDGSVLCGTYESEGMQATTREHAISDAFAQVRKKGSVGKEFKEFKEVKEPGSGHHKATSILDQMDRMEHMSQINEELRMDEDSVLQEMLEKESMNTPSMRGMQALSTPRSALRAFGDMSRGSGTKGADEDDVIDIILADDEFVVGSASTMIDRNRVLSTHL